MRLQNDYRRLPLGIVIALLIGLSTTTHAQTVIGMGTDQPNPHAVLELVPTQGNQGFLAPRLTRAQRTAPSFTRALGDADHGLLVFDTDAGGFFYWYRGAWHQGVTGEQSNPTASPRGTSWYTGPAAPSGIPAAEGDFYINESNGEVYKFKDGTFQPIGSLASTNNGGSPGEETLASVLERSNSADNRKITNLATPTEDRDAATKQYVDDQLTPIIGGSGDQTLREVLTEGNDAGGSKIINLADPEDNQDAVTKKYYEDNLPVLTPSASASLLEGRIWLGDSDDKPTPVTISGDIEMDAKGKITIKNARITTDMLKDKAVTTAKLDDGAVTDKKLADEAVKGKNIHPDVAGHGLTQAENGSLQVALEGDVATDKEKLTVIRLQGKDIANTAPSGGQVLQWNDATDEWTPTTLSGGGSDRAGTWYTGNNQPNPGNPSGAATGDFYLRQETREVLVKEGNTWTSVGYLSTTAGGGDSTADDGRRRGGLLNTVKPTNANAEEGMLWLDEAANEGGGAIKVRRGNNWVQILIGDN